MSRGVRRRAKRKREARFRHRGEKSDWRGLERLEVVPLATYPLASTLPAPSALPLPRLLRPIRLRIEPPPPPILATPRATDNPVRAADDHRAALAARPLYRLRPPRLVRRAHIVRVLSPPLRRPLNRTCPTPRVQPTLQLQVRPERRRRQPLLAARTPFPVPERHNPRPTIKPRKLPRRFRVLRFSPPGIWRSLRGGRYFCARHPPAYACWPTTLASR
jgi:hypothetical protein